MRVKEPVGIKTPLLRAVSNKVFKTTVRSYTKDEILDIGDEMLACDRRHRRFSAFDWAQKINRRCPMHKFESWQFFLEIRGMVSKRHSINPDINSVYNPEQQIKRENHLYDQISTQGFHAEKLIVSFVASQYLDLALLLELQCLSPYFRAGALVVSAPAGGLSDRYSMRVRTGDSTDDQTR